MFVELINDLFMSSSVFYLYFGLLIVTFGIGQLSMVHQNGWKMRANFSLIDHQYMKIDVSLIEKPLINHELYIRWFIKALKRIDTLDDDKEDASNSYFNRNSKIRGGQLWEKAAYSPAYVDIVLLF